MDVGRTVEVPALTAPSAPPLLELVSMGILVLGLGFGVGFWGWLWFVVVAFIRLLVVVCRIESLGHSIYISLYVDSKETTTTSYVIKHQHCPKNDVGRQGYENI